MKGLDLVFFLTVSGKTTEAYKLEAELKKQGIKSNDFCVQSINFAYMAGWRAKQNKKEYTPPTWAIQSSVLQNAFAQGFNDYKNFKELSRSTQCSK